MTENTEPAAVVATTTETTDINKTDTQADPTPYAGFWRRLLALILDGIVLGILLNLLGRATDGMLAFNESSVSAVTFSFSVAFLLQVLYYAGFESSSSQATPGKRIVGIIVTDLDGKQITFTRALARNAAKFISAIILYIGFIMAAFTDKKQALHDMFAKCLVVRQSPANTTQEKSVTV